MGDLKVTRPTYCNFKRTNWESYREDLQANLGVVSRVALPLWDVELAVDMVQQAILSLKLSSPGDSLGKDRSLVEQRVELP
jgi:hypothetical protein